MDARPSSSAHGLLSISPPATDNHRDRVDSSLHRASGRSTRSMRNVAPSNHPLAGRDDRSTSIPLDPHNASESQADPIRSIRDRTMDHTGSFVATSPPSMVNSAIPRNNGGAFPMTTTSLTHPARTSQPLVDMDSTNYLPTGVSALSPGQGSSQRPESPDVRFAHIPPSGLNDDEQHRPDTLLNAAPHQTEPALRYPRPGAYDTPNIRYADLETINAEFRAGIQSDADIWKSYTEEAAQQDRDSMANWNQSMDVILVFAALFSAILTAFIIQFYNGLQPSPQQITADLLANITLTLHALANSQAQTSTSLAGAFSVETITSFKPPALALWVNGLWFASLTSSMGAAMAAMVVKQWLQFYALNLNSGTAYENAHRRQYRYNALVAWHVPGIISTLPLLLHLSVVLFSIGLIIQLFQINLQIASAVLLLMALLFMAYTATLLLPAFWPACPYKSSAMTFILPSLQLFFNRIAAQCYHLYTALNQALQGGHAEMEDTHMPDEGNKYNLMMNDHQAVHSEASHIQSMQHKLDLESILWILKASQKQEVVDLALASLGEVQYTTNMVQELQKHNVPALLAHKSYVALPSQEHNFWQKLNVMKSDSTLHSKMIQATAYMKSLMYIWHHPEYLVQSHPPAISNQERAAPYSWLLGDWLLFWRSLRRAYGSDYQQLAAQGWDIDCFSVLVCTEVHYYHLHQQLSPIFSNVSTSMELNALNPFYDLQELLEAHALQKLILQNDTLSLLLDSLAFVLSNMEKSQHIHERKDTLSILLQLLRIYNSLQDPITPKLIICIQMFILDSSGQKKRFIKDHAGTLSRNELYAFSHQTFSTLLQIYIPKVEPSTNVAAVVPVESVSLMALEHLYWNIIRQSKPTTDYNGVLLSLPMSYADRLIQFIYQAGPQQARTIESAQWLIDISFSWFTNLTLSSQERMIYVFEGFLGSIWPERDLAIVTGKIIPFMVQLLQNDNVLGNLACIAFCRVLQETSFVDYNMKLLFSFLDLKAMHDICNFLSSISVSKESLVYWTQFEETWQFDISRRPWAYTSKHREAYEELHQTLSVFRDQHDDQASPLAQIPSTDNSDSILLVDSASFQSPQQSGAYTEILPQWSDTLASVT